MDNRTWKTWLISAAVTGSFALGAVALTSQGSDASTSSVTATPAATTPVATATAEPSTDALAAIVTDAAFAVSVLDVATGATLTYGDGTFDTASIVKVDILAALLHQHQEAGTELTATQQVQAAAMIEQSDNAAATALFEAVGAEAGLETFNELIGLDDTDVGADGGWGLTQTTSADQIRLLQVVLGDTSVLSTAAQAYVQELMSHVVQNQNFGVSAAADDPDEAALKVGYLQRSATGLWDVTSIGRIEAAGHTYLVAVLSDGNASLETGTALVDRIARAAVAATT
jgi:beta-lactamase class A